MKVLVVHNEYGSYSGEEASVQHLLHMLEQEGHTVIPYLRSSSEIPHMAFGALRAFFAGIYNRSARERMKRYISECSPDIVHVHNLFPLISPSILSVCRQNGVPVVMTVHNYRLVCPHGLYYSHGTICERCNHGKEYWCVIRNCERHIGKSFGYAVRNYYARTRRLFLDTVTLYICLTDYQRHKLIDQGFSAERMDVIPPAAPSTAAEKNVHSGETVDYIGRISCEKGIGTFLQAAALCPALRFRVAGSCENKEQVKKKAPSNVTFLGHISQKDMASVYNESRIVVLPSVWYEGFPMVLIEAMIEGKPIIASRIGGIPEIVIDNVNGLLFEPGNGTELAQKIKYLWARPDICQRLGTAGREKAGRDYSPEKQYSSLHAAYKKALAIN